MRRAYIGPSGRITNSNRIRLQDFRWKRIALLSSALAILVISNPANDFLWKNLKLVEDIQNRVLGNTQRKRRENRKSKKSRTLLGSFTLDWLGIEIDIRASPSSNRNPYFDAYDSTRRRRFTNYGIFSLSESADGVEMGALFLNIPICSHYGLVPQVCDFIGTGDTYIVFSCAILERFAFLTIW